MAFTYLQEETGRRARQCLQVSPLVPASSRQKWGRLFRSLFSFFKVSHGFGDVMMQAGGEMMTNGHIPKARLKFIKYFHDYDLIEPSKAEIMSIL